MSYFISVSDSVRDHFIDETNLRYMKIVLNAALTLTPVKISCTANEDYQRWQIQIKNRDVYSVGQYANNSAVISISHNGTDWVVIFTGYVSDSGFVRSRGTITNDYITFTCVDATSRKGTKRKPDPVLLSGFDICDTVSPSASILHYLADLMDVTLNATSIAYTKTLVELGDNTAWEELQKVKEAYHADMYFDALGQLFFISPFDTGYSAPTSEWTFQGDPDNAVSGDACRIHGTLEETYLPVRCNYARTNFDELEVLSSQVIYKNTEGYNSATDQISIDVAAGAYWPGTGASDLAKLNYADPDSGETFPFATPVTTPTIGTTGSGNEIEYTGGTLTLVSFNGSTAATVQGADHAQIILQNTGGSTCTITKLTIEGTPYRLKENKIIEVIDSGVTDAFDYVQKDIDGKFATSSSQIHDTLYYIKEEGKGRPRQFRFSAPFMPWLQRNAIVNVQPPGESAVRCRIDTYQHQNRGRTLQSMFTTIICTELDTYTPSGTPTVKVDSPISPVLAKITSISPNAGATYRSASTSAPTTPQLGDLWYQTDTQLMKRYSGSSWENTGASPLEESVTAGVAFETSTGKVKIYDDGSFEFGSLNAAKNAGGIGYDVTEDRLYGNVAYDQWDLVIESDADLALLHDRTAWATSTAYTVGDKVKNDSLAYVCVEAHTSSASDEPGVGASWETYWELLQYTNVLITPGTYTTSVKIDLKLYSTKRFVGVNLLNCTIQINFDPGAGSIIEVFASTEFVGNFSVDYIYATAPSDNSGAVFNVENATNINIENISISGCSGKLHGIYGDHGVSTLFDSGVYSNKHTRIKNVLINGCYKGFYNITALKGCYATACTYGANACTDISGGEFYDNTYGITSSFLISNTLATGNSIDGFGSCYLMSNCLAYDNVDDGFSGCDNVSSCYAYDNGGDGFVNCDRVTGCESRDNFSGIGMNTCYRVSSTFSTNNSTNWASCDSVDYDSTNCDQEWVYGSWSVTTSGIVPTRGSYMVACSSASIDLEIYDGSAWQNSNAVLGGLMYFDGTNMRLISSSGTITVHYRKKP